MWLCEYHGKNQVAILAVSYCSLQMTKGMTPENGVCYVAARSLWHWKSQPDFN
jgi:hypothetical protein